MEHTDQIQEALGQAGMPTTFTPEMQDLERMRITPDKALQPMDFLFRLFGKPCFPRGELVAITGKAKSGKTFLTSMLMACCTVRDVLCLHRERDEPLRVMWYDTEQSDESTQDILRNRLVPMTGGQVQAMDVFNVRAMPWQRRRLLLAEAINRYRPDLVVVDGIRDLVNDINDGVLAQEVMEELMQLATAGKCCITCILHQNKGSEDHNLRGWIGTELMNKAFEVYACEKMMPQRIFKVEQTLTRKYDIEQTMYFTVGQDGLPALCAVPAAEAATPTDREPLPQLNREYIVTDDDEGSGKWEIDVMRLFLDAMRGQDEIGGQELKQEVCRLANIAQYRFYNKLLQRALDEKVIERTERDRRTYYRPAPF
ncbi:MAG: AAA family ATPase [Bacteroidaceae bacterium]|nr:AAA family ATPase [Bacteroidaceae bacterium]